ncbi:nUDIX hydrolase [Mycoplasma sp. CAG:472]|nr:nUDIX hydrolase [Mycoplasma sp. CAG:472]
MDIEKLKEEFIKLKKEELEYLDNIAKLGYQKTFSQEEKLNIYRKLKFYENENAKFYKILSDILYKSKEENMDKVFIEIKLKDDFFNKVSDIFNRHRYLILRRYNINLETNSYILTVKDIIDERYTKYRYEDFDYLFNNQELFEKPIYIFTYYDDHSDEYFLFDFTTGIYSDFVYGDRKEISVKEMENFEKGKIIMRVTSYVDEVEVSTIFREELLNENNKTLEDCANSTMIRVNKLNYLRSPEYKEKMLLEKITKLYDKVKGNLTKEEILYSGDFINLIREVYSLPNNRTITREKIVKNGGKDSVIIVATDSNGNYILTFQTRINDKIIAEFPSGYIEDGEGVIEAAKRELKEETGYVSDIVTLLDEFYYSVGIDNSICYIVRMKNSVKAFDVNSNENLTYGIFTEEELKYLLNNNIMCGGLNKLAYYSLQNKGCKRTLRNVK